MENKKQGLQELENRLRDIVTLISRNSKESYWARENTEGDADLHKNAISENNI